MKAIVLIFGLITLGCASNNIANEQQLPCLPASHYAASKDAPYVAQEVRVNTEEGHVLVGTLTLPKKAERPSPAVILISGSNAQTRDMVGSTAEPGSLYQPFRQIADSLSRQGIAVLRLDDRGAGCSGGGPLAASNTAERAKDTQAALTYLNNHEEVDRHRVGLLGISEGANIAVMISASNYDLRAVITMAASASPGWEIWEYQTRYKISLGEEMDQAKKKRWLAGENPETILKERVAEARAHVHAGKANSWWTFFFTYDPSIVATNITSPILILHGDRDSNVPVAHAYKLAEAVKSGGNTDVTVEIFVDHNHLFLPDKDGGFRNYSSLLTHTNQIPVPVLDTISNWLDDKL